MKYFFTTLGAFRLAKDNSSTGEPPGVSKIVYASDNLFLAKLNYCSV